MTFQPIEASWSRNGFSTSRTRGRRSWGGFFQKVGHAHAAGEEVFREASFHQAKLLACDGLRSLSIDGGPHEQRDTVLFRPAQGNGLPEADEGVQV